MLFFSYFLQSYKELFKQDNKKSAAQYFRTDDWSKR